MSKWQFWIDVGGTFTDCLARSPSGEIKTFKLLSSGVFKGKGRLLDGARLATDRTRDPHDFFRGWQARFYGPGGAPLSCDAFPVKAFDPATGVITLKSAPKVTGEVFYELLPGTEAPVVGIHWLLDLPLDAPLPDCEVKLGTTRGTNALLERQGARTAFLTTQGFGDALEIGYQNRPKLFALDIRKPKPLYEHVVEIRERLAADGSVIEPLDETHARAELERLKAEGVASLAICLMHSYKNGVHEERLAALAEKLGFQQISVSSRLAALQRLVPRAETTVVDAYLTPVIREYVASLMRAMPKADLKLMTSAGALTPAGAFVGKDSILSGPAGGVVGVARVAKEAGLTKVIGFDMGGTSTDVCHFDGNLARRYEMELKDPEGDGGARVVAPMLAIETVAAGGGSLCWFDGVRLRVGPRSAGADPGPACYGRGGPLGLTDCNLYLGRLDPERFKFPLDHETVTARLDEIREQVARATGQERSREEIAAGFLAIAASNMAQPIKEISVGRGYDVRDYALVSFGGAGSQHACAVAEELGMKRVVKHPYASLLSAYGIGTADVSKFAAEDVGMLLSKAALMHCENVWLTKTRELTEELARELGVASAAKLAPSLVIKRFLDLRYVGQDATITIGEPESTDWIKAFEGAHRQQYGFVHPGRPLEIRALRLEVTAPQEVPSLPAAKAEPHAPSPTTHRRSYIGNAWREIPVYVEESLAPGAHFQGPALVVAEDTVTVVDPGWTATLTAQRHLVLERKSEKATQRISTEVDPVQLTLFNNRFASIAEQMGAALQRTSLSVNVKERLDFSCAIFTASGDLVVNAPHIPVHLGSMGDTVRAIIREIGTMRPGETYVTNDPYRGGSHLPDVTVVSPVFDEKGEKLLFFTGNRAHHAEIGGITPGSMPPHSKSLAEEGVLIRPFRLVADDRASEDAFLRLLSSGPYPSRSVQDNLADIRAQIAANELGRQLLTDLVRTYGFDVVEAYMGHIRDAATRKMQQALLRLPGEEFSFADHLDDGSPIRVAIRLARHRDGTRASIDFTGTGPVMQGNLNANPAIVRAAVLYSFRCLIDEDIPLNEGVLAPLEIVIPSPSLLAPPGGDDAKKLAAVVGGNVETSQRLVDVLLGALGLAAASQGTMNNFLFGRARDGDRAGFGYYETICGGAGAGPGFAGASAVQTHMTNTRITDAEVIEERFPVRVRRFAVRRGSGGQGRYRGGDGAIREIEFLEPLSVSLMTSRRAKAPYGLAGGLPGSPGRNILVKANGNEEVVPGFTQLAVEAGEILRIETPGGGGYGSPPPG